MYSVSEEKSVNQLTDIFPSKDWDAVLLYSKLTLWLEYFEDKPFYISHDKQSERSYFQSEHIGQWATPHHLSVYVGGAHTPHIGYVTLCYFNHCQHKNHVTMVYHVIDSKLQQTPRRVNDIATLA